MFIYLPNIYIAPLKDTKSALCAAYMKLNVIMNKYFHSINKTKYSTMGESPEVIPRTCVEPTCKK